MFVESLLSGGSVLSTEMHARTQDTTQAWCSLWCKHSFIRHLLLTQHVFTECLTVSVMKALIQERGCNTANFLLSGCLHLGKRCWELDFVRYGWQQQRIIKLGICTFLNKWLYFLPSLGEIGKPILKMQTRFGMHIMAMSCREPSRGEYVWPQGCTIRALSSMCQYLAFHGTLLLSLWGATWMGRCSFMHVCMVSCVQLFATQPCSCVHGIFQVRILEKWVAIYSSRGSSWTGDQTHVSSISCFGGRFFTTEPLGEKAPPLMQSQVKNCLPPPALHPDFGFLSKDFIWVFFFFFQKECLQLSLMLLILIPSLHSQEGKPAAE